MIGEMFWTRATTCIACLLIGAWWLGTADRQFHPEIGRVASARFLALSCEEMRPDRCSDPLVNCHSPTMPCVISRDLGGLLTHYLYAAQTVARRVPGGVIVDGVCASGCAIFASWARPSVCLTVHARLEFHKSNLEDDPPYPADVQRWIDEKGGTPSNASGDMIRMSFPETLRYFRWCKVPER